MLTKKKKGEGLALPNINYQKQHEFLGTWYVITLNICPICQGKSQFCPLFQNNY